MKKVLTVLLSFVLSLCLLLPALAGCTGGGDPEPEPPKPASLKLAGMRTEFAYGEDFSSEGLTVTVVYSDKTEKPSENFTVDASKYKKDVSGSYSISVTCENLKKSYTVKVAAAPEKKITALKCSGMKTEFEFMEDFSAEGLTVTAVYEDETEGTLSSDRYVVEPAEFNQEQAGQYDILVICGDIVGFYTVTVKEETHWWTSEMKILSIGNSFSVDATEYVYQIARAKGVKVELGTLYIGSCTVNMHADNLKNDRPVYEYYTNVNGKWKTKQGVRLREAIEERDWDIISMQSGSGDGSVITHDDAYDRLGELKDLVMEHVTNENVRFAWQMFWAREAGSTVNSYVEAGSNQLEEYRRIVEATRKNVIERFGIELVYPSGTAIQNARTSFLGANGLSRDSNHLSFGMGRYTAGLTLFMTLTGVSVEGLDWAPDSVSPREQLVAIESAVNAVNHPWEVTQSQYK